MYQSISFIQKVPFNCKWAIPSKHEENIEALLAPGANIDDETSSDAAIGHDSKKIIHLLLAKYERGKCQINLLEIAAKFGRMGVLKEGFDRACSELNRYNPREDVNGMVFNVILSINGSILRVRIFPPRLPRRIQWYHDLTLQFPLTQSQSPLNQGLANRIRSTSSRAYPPGSPSRQSMREC